MTTAARTRQARKSPATGEISVADALDVCARGFAVARSLTHPYHVERVDGLWHMHDAPRNQGTYRTEEWWASGTPATDVDAAARQHSHGRFVVCALLNEGHPNGELRDQYRAIGYRLLRTEPLMVRTLDRIGRPNAAIEVERVRDRETADILAKAARARQLLPEHLEPGAALRRYVAWDADEIVGWVGSIAVGAATYCDNMFVREDHRRRGIATAMLSHMLRDDRAQGARSAVLLASHMGPLLYPNVGYHQIGMLNIYQPPKQAGPRQPSSAATAPTIR